jgi:hypothetical protein
VDTSAEAPGRCARDGAPGTIRLHLTEDPAVRVDLCQECFRLHAVMRAEDAATLSMLRAAAPRIAGTIWQGGAEFFLLRAVAPAAAGGRHYPVLSSVAPLSSGPEAVPPPRPDLAFNRWAPGAN